MSNWSLHKLRVSQWRPTSLTCLTTGQFVKNNRAGSVQLRRFVPALIVADLLGWVMRALAGFVGPVSSFR